MIIERYESVTGNNKLHNYSNYFFPHDHDRNIYDPVVSSYTANPSETEKDFERKRFRDLHECVLANMKDCLNLWPSDRLNDEVNAQDKDGVSPFHVSNSMQL
jgi:hypothetical protein